MKKLGPVAVVVASLLATFAGIKYAKEQLQIESTQADIEKVKETGEKEAEWVRVDGNGHIISPVDLTVIRKADNLEKVKEAEWVKVEGNENITFYANPATIGKAGNKVKMLTLVDYKTVNKSGGYPHMSTKTQHEYDCTENQWRLLGYSYYSGNMGGGELVYTDAELGTWEPVKLGSGTQIRWKIACGKQ